MKTNTQILDRFKDYVRDNYNNCDLTTSMICSNIYCSRGYLYEILNREYNYTCMQYVDYVRVLHSMEFICNGMKKIYSEVGYKSSSVFSKIFLRVTGFNVRCFRVKELKKYKNIIPVVYDIATKDPKKAIEFIINKSSIQSILFKQKQKFNVHLKI